MPRVLIVEDDPVIRKMLETCVRLEGYDVHLAPDGDQGLASLLRLKPDICLTDINMPGILGTELVARARADESVKHTYFIILTGQGEQGTKLEALRAGTDDFLVKPTTAPEILGRLEIAQRVIATHRSELEAIARAEKAEGALAGAVAELDVLDGLLAQAEKCIASRNVKDLVGAIESAKAAAAKLREATAAAAPPKAEDSWL